MQIAVRMTSADLKLKADHETLITATFNGDLDGCFFCRPQDDWLYVGKMAVVEQRRGSGTGWLLIDHAKSLARMRAPLRGG